MLKEESYRYQSIAARKTIISIPSIICLIARFPLMRKGEIVEQIVSLIHTHTHTHTHTYMWVDMNKLNLKKGAQGEIKIKSEQDQFKLKSELCEKGDFETKNELMCKRCIKKKVNLC